MIQIHIASTYEDCVAIEKMAAEIWTEHYTPIIGEKQVSYMLKTFQSAKKIEHDITTNHFLYLLPYYQDLLVGYAAVKILDDSLFISKFYIHHSFRGQKLSSSLFEYIRNICIENSCSRIWLTVNKNNTESISIYKHFGFSVTEELVTDIGQGFVMDDYKMSINI